MSHTMERLTLSGRIVTGLGQGASFTQLDWAREQFVVGLGIDPYPGTVNIVLETSADVDKWDALKTEAGHSVVPPGPGSCRARCYPVRLNGRLPGAIILPEVPGYPQGQIEVIAALSARETLSLSDGERIMLEISQPLPVRAVIFDVDGTLVDSVEAYRVVAEQAASPLGIAVTRDDVCRALNTDQPFWEMLLPADQPDRAGTIKQLRDDAAGRWQDVLQMHGRTFPGLRGTLQTLQAWNMHLGIVTGSREGSLQLLSADGLSSFFSVVITGKDVTRRKPDPEGLLKCAEALGVDPADAVYVGDTPLDVQASRAAGMYSVAVLSGAGDSALLSAAGPDWIIHSHSYLFRIIHN